MITLQYVIPLIVTPAAVNAKLTILNAAYAGLTGYTAVPALDTTYGVVNIWTKALSDVDTLPAIGWEVGFLSESEAEIDLQGKNRDGYAVTFVAIAQAGDPQTAQLQVAVLWEALRMVIDDPTGAGLEGQPLPGVTPTRQIVQIGPTVRVEPVTITTKGAGERLGFRSKWKMVVDTVRS